ncbi:MULTISPECIES: V-type ATP synthase subunit E [Halobacterium]|uniref:A-type ATP synthase subunit E n=5 Tax=Halobacterium salinarum TaxID=2242 RepID=AATE_HALSA|nr:MULTISPECIES: V-type ATP synthase subunit E [Halobacterium]B0R758.1 RecName: Full=V-type proton ATPase subunit E; AltName: Full=V-ATPase subunit E [Halobacterium salinarum R1]Q9HNE0.1 RecName: Full=V-type ATP synthase subunit E; AltName: Full=V-ATPase subunit E [Halobacterium salinarum NRC-1]AAG20280.1 H+-transporting ATP synthase subunit E [Halobacterium salinarum NRC-1]MBB6089297.1 V/A-type H+-transporting ATPase subunit E [Halobacterium salinarum]MCF2165900.1 V-type ATP synthase subunit 
MSLETVVEDIRDEARERAKEIRADADERADEIVAEAEADADDIIADAEAEVTAEIDQEREQQLSSAELEAKQMRLEARRDALQSVRSAVEDRIVALDGDEREELTRELLDAASTEFDGADTVRVFGRADDEALISEILDDYDGYEYAGEYDCLGGVVVESDASRIRVNNTFDSILADAWENNLKAISARLFDEEQ